METFTIFVVFNTLVIATHGFIKKTQKTPSKEIARANEIMKAYFAHKK